MLGTAYGVIFAANNIFQIVFPIILGSIQVAAGFEAVSLTLLGIAFIALGITIWLWHYDKYSMGGMLQKKNPYDMYMEQSMSQQVIINVGDQSVVVDVEDKGHGEGYSFREFPKDRLDESYRGKPRDARKSRRGYVPPEIIQLQQ